MLGHHVLLMDLLQRRRLSSVGFAGLCAEAFSSAASASNRFVGYTNCKSSCLVWNRGSCCQLRQLRLFIAGKTGLAGILSLF